MVITPIYAAFYVRCDLFWFLASILVPGGLRGKEDVLSDFSKSRREFYSKKTISYQSVVYKSSFGEAFKTTQSKFVYNG